MENNLFVKDSTKARDLDLGEHVFRLRWKYDEFSPSMFAGQIDLALYEDCRGLDDLLPIVKKSGCPHAIYEQILKHGNPDYIFNIADSAVDPELKYQGFGEQLYLKSFEALAEKLDASILFIADMCALSSTSEDAEKLWKKLARMQDAEHHFAWFQPKPQKDRDQSKHLSISLDECRKFNRQSCEEYAKAILRRLESAEIEHREVVKDVRVVTTPFYFVHFTEKNEHIAHDGFMGETSELLDTKTYGGNLDSSGHIFAFRIDGDSLQSAYAELERIYEEAYGEYDEDEDEDDCGLSGIWAWTPFGIYGDGLVIAKAQMGVEFFSGGDHEVQIIIPIACIDQSEMHSEYEFLEDHGLHFY